MDVVGVCEIIGYCVVVLTVSIVVFLFGHYTRIKSRVTHEDRRTTKELGVTVILPIYGKYQQNEQAKVWDNVLHQEYQGKVNFCFVCEGLEDPAYFHFKEYLQTNGYNTDDLSAPIVTNFNKNFSVQLVVAGPSFHNSQKVHNLTIAMLQNTKDSEYVVFFDDDLHVNRHALQNIIYPLETDPDVGISTGYSVFVPSQHTLSSYMWMVYRQFNLLGFMTERVNYCWGGCFAVRKKDIMGSHIPLIFLDGGYSDDMLIGNYYKQAGKKIVAIPQNMFVNRQEDEITFRNGYYNYVKRQYFTLTTYFNKKDKIVNTITLMQLLTGGIITTSFMVLAFLDIAYNVYIGRYIRVYQIIALLLSCLYFAGRAINSSVYSTQQLIRRVSGQEVQYTQLNNLLTGFSTVFHFSFTGLMVIQILLCRKIRWGHNTYSIRDGRVESVKRANCGRSIDKVSSLQKMLLSYQDLIGITPKT